MDIQAIVSTFPDFAKIWAEKRLTRLLNQTGSLPNEEMLISVKDYLSSLTPEDKIYQKLNKVSWNDMVQLQKNWHEAIARKSEKMTEFGGDSRGEIFIDCGNGYRWIELKTPEQLDFEGNAMGHCIGKGSYDKSKNHFYSLRDSKNLPHATVEFDPERNEYIQIKGRANQPVIADYWEDAVKIFNVLGIENGLKKFAHGRDYVYSQHKIYFEPEDFADIITDETVLTASAKIENTSFGITTEGKFLLLNKAPPEETIFKKVVLKKDSEIRDWKWDVSGDFDASRSLLESVSVNVKFGKDVYISRTNVKHWTHDVPGNFRANELKLETISDNVKFGKDVYIRETKLKNWKHDVPGNFYAYAALLETISDNVKFGGSVDIGNTKIKLWTHDVPGDFNAVISLLETVSDNVKFGGSVSIQNTNVKLWKHDVPVDFRAKEAKLEVISDNVRFGGSVDIAGTGIKIWKHDVPRNFYTYDSLLESISDNVKFGSGFYAFGSLLETISNSVKFGGVVDIRNTKIKLWKHDVPGDFRAVGSLLKIIEEGVKFGGTIYVEPHVIRNDLRHVVD